MANNRAEVRREIEVKRASLGQKLEVVENLIGEKIATLKNSVDLKYQVRTHPWAMAGLAAFTGYLLKKVFSKLFLRSERLPAPARSYQSSAANDGGSFFKALLGSVSGFVLRDLARRTIDNLRWSEHQRRR